MGAMQHRMGAHLKIQSPLAPAAAGEFGHTVERLLPPMPLQGQTLVGIVQTWQLQTIRMRAPLVLLLPRKLQRMQRLGRYGR